MARQDGGGLLALADDLTGAAETAGALLLHATRIEVRLIPSPNVVTATFPTDFGHSDSSMYRVLDLDCRYRSRNEVDRLVRSAIARADGSRVVAKIDSLLRGSPDQIVRALGSDGAPVIVATALPSADRSVIGGVVHLAGVPMHETDAWRMEDADPPRSVPAALAPLASRIVGLEVIRSSGLAEALRSSLDADAVPICDAQTAADLDLIAAAALSISSARLVGSGGLMHAMARALAPLDAPDYVVARPPRPADRTVLVVVGSAAPAASEQTGRLSAAGLGLVRLRADAIEHEPARSSAARQVRQALAAGSTVVVLDPPADREPATHIAAQHLARIVGEALTPAPGAPAGPMVDLVLTGGETARRVLDALEVNVMTPVAELHPGAVHCLTADGRAVVTRAGSFGHSDSLLDIVQYLHRSPHAADQTLRAN